MCGPVESVLCGTVSLLFDINSGSAIARTTTKITAIATPAIFPGGHFDVAFFRIFVIGTKKCQNPKDRARMSAIRHYISRRSVSRARKTNYQLQKISRTYPHLLTRAPASAPRTRCSPAFQGVYIPYANPSERTRMSAIGHRISSRSVSRARVSSALSVPIAGIISVPGSSSCTSAQVCSAG